MKRYPLIISITLGLCLIFQASWATKAYVTDSFRISLRAGPSIENKILKFISSGTYLEVLETGESWSQVRLLEPEGSDVRGWVLSRYLITRRPWEAQTKTFMGENAKLIERVGILEEENKEISLRDQKLARDLEKFRTAFHKLRYEHDLLKKEATDYLKMKSAYENMKKRVESLAHENEVIQSAQINKWFAYGALVLLCGLMIGLVVGRQQRKRRSSLYV
jgi:SH3 domain protein